MRTALVLSGHIRTFNLLKKNFKNFLIQNHCDVYCHFWREDNDKIGDVLRVLNPLRCMIEDSELYAEEFQETEKLIREKNPKKHNTDKIFRTLSMHYARKQAFNLIEKEYDFIVFSRYDTKINPLIIQEYISKNKNTVIVPQNEAYGMFSDIFAIIPFEHSKKYFLYDEIFDLFSKPFSEEFKDYLKERFNWPNSKLDIETHDKKRYCPHILYLINAHKSNMPYVLNDLPVNLQR